MLDNADAETLGTYCMIISRLENYYKEIQCMSNDLERLYDEGDYKEIEAMTAAIAENVKRVESTERLQLQYSCKLGLNPDSRLRLAKRSAEPEVDPDEDLYG